MPRVLAALLLFCAVLHAQTRVISYSSYFGGTGADSIRALAVDGTGIYIAGTTTSADLPLVNAAQTARGGMFATKLDLTGGVLIYSTYLGELGLGTEARALAVDASGSAWIAGVLQRIAETPPRAVVMRLDATGRLAFNTPLGGGAARANAIAIDRDGNAVVAGWAGPGFPTTSGALEPAAGDQGGAFVAKISPAGAVLFATYVGGSSGAEAAGIAVDASGAIYITGSVSRSGFPATPGALQTQVIPAASCFVSKLNAAGSALAYSTLFAGRTSGAVFPTTYCNAIAVDAMGSAYVTGTTTARDLPVTTGAFQTEFRGRCTLGGSSCVGRVSSNAFVAKLNATATALVYSTYVGGTGTGVGGDNGRAIAVDTSGRAHVAGSSSTGDFPVRNAIQLLAENAWTDRFDPAQDAFATVLNPTGTALEFSTYIGGSTADTAYALRLEPGGVFTIAGTTGSGLYASRGPTTPPYNNFPVTAGAFQPSPKFLTLPEIGVVGLEGFLTRISPGPGVAAPEISLLQPWVLSAGQPSASVEVYGENFTANSVVLWNGSQRPTEFLDSTRLVAHFTAADLAQSGEAAVAVATLGPARSLAALSSSRRFQVARSVGLLMVGVADLRGNPLPNATIRLDRGTPLAVDANGRRTIALEPRPYDLTVEAPGFAPAQIAVSAFAGQSTTVSVPLLPGAGPGRGTFVDPTAESGTDTGMDVRAGQILLLYANGGWTHNFPAQAAATAQGLAGCRSGGGWKLPDNYCGALAARIGDGPWFYVGPAFLGAAPASGRLHLAMNDAPGGYGDNSGYMEVTVALPNTGACTAEPVLRQSLPPGFYIAEITTQPGTREGYWGMEVLADRGLLAGGFNLGGAVQELGTTAGFGAFYIERAQTVRVRVDAQVIPGGDVNNAGLTVRLLNASRQPVGEARSGTAAVEFSESLQPGFYIIEIVAAASAARATYQMGLGADLFSAGMNLGGFVLPGVTGFGAFYLPETQYVSLQVYGLPTYTSAGAPCLRLRLLDADRRVLFTAP